VVPTIGIPADVVDRVLSAHGVQPWFSYVYHERSKRWDVWQPCAWLADSVSKRASILETGCGVGFNLIWLAERGFLNLDGFDIDEKAIAAGNSLCERARLKVSLWVDDGMKPEASLTRDYAAIVALNWTIYIDGFSLKAFLDYYSSLLGRNGVIVFDMVDKSYDTVENNEYLSSDWGKPRHLRRPSEYRVRMKRAEIDAAIESSDFLLVKEFRVPQAIPKAVYVVRKRCRAKEED
jgi:SAM-dependent methyltransferase